MVNPDELLSPFHQDGRSARSRSTRTSCFMCHESITLVSTKSSPASLYPPRDPFVNLHVVRVSHFRAFRIARSVGLYGVSSRVTRGGAGMGLAKTPPYFFYRGSMCSPFIAYYAACGIINVLLHFKPLSQRFSLIIRQD
jgi:hypothetical protein